MGTKTRPLESSEFAQYIDVLNSASGNMLCYAAVMAIICGCGARIGEARTMRHCDLFDRSGNPLARITRTLEKKRSKRRVRKTIDFPWQELGGPLIRWRKTVIKRFCIQHEECIFTLNNAAKPISRYACWLANKTLLTQAGINPAGVAQHGIRKSFLYMMYQQRLTECGDAMQALLYVRDLAGHGSIDTTARYLKEYLGGDHITTARAAFARLKTESDTVQK